MEKENSHYRRWMKRCLDLMLTFPALVILAPVMAVIALLVRMNLGDPVIYCQSRPGLLGHLFTFYKFRTMTDARNTKGDMLPDEQRITRLGRALRKTSFDELPELWNVLKGDMSLVGPRPLLVEYLSRYTPEQARRHDVKPGITGWAQVNGRNALTWEEKFEFDVWYVDNWTLWLDLKILFITAFKVLKGEGISQPGFATMEEFKGKGEENERSF